MLLFRSFCGQAWENCFQAHPAVLFALTTLRHCSIPAAPYRVCSDTFMCNTALSLEHCFTYVVLPHLYSTVSSLQHVLSHFCSFVSSLQWRLIYSVNKLLRIVLTNCGNKCFSISAAPFHLRLISAAPFHLCSTLFLCSTVTFLQFRIFSATPHLLCSTEYSLQLHFISGSPPLLSSYYYYY